jgi:hypothetical protein
MFSHDVPNLTSLYPISFSQSSLFTYIGEPKGEALHPHIETTIFGEPLEFQFFWVMGQSKWSIVSKNKYYILKTELGR